jgi:hypothetical protein
MRSPHRWKERAMTFFNYAREAELFAFSSRKMRVQGARYRRFASVADAIRFAMEELEPQTLLAAHLQVDEERFDAAGIRRLYDSHDYPLLRRVAAAA